MADLIKGKDKFKKNCEEATKFIESCFDENNENDGLTFDERIQKRADELPAPVRNIVVASQNWEAKTLADDEIEELVEIGEDDCECGDCFNLPPAKKLGFAIDAKQEYLDKKRELNTEKARLRLETDWTTAIEGKNKPNDTDKKEWIAFETHELQEEVDDLKCEADYLWELWELEKIMLRKQ